MKIEYQGVLTDVKVDQLSCCPIYNDDGEYLYTEYTFVVRSKDG